MSLDDLAARYVAPFYLDMMRVNAVAHGPALAAHIAQAGRGMTAADVIRLLALDWRKRVMGAWYAVMVGGPEVTAAVLRALRTSHGSLDALPLAAAAVTLAGPDALGALKEYFAADEAEGWGADGWIAAAAHHLVDHYAVTTALPCPASSYRDTFSALLDIARRLQSP